MKLIHFEKKLGVAGAISITVGAVIGVGIFVIIGPIGANTGPWMTLAFLAAAVPAIVGTVVSVALGSTIPADGGGYYYSKSLFGSYAGVVASALIVIGALGSITAVSVGISDYFIYFWPGLPRIGAAIGIILFTWLINWIGIMASEKLQIAMVVQFLIAFAVVLIVALAKGVHPDFSQPLPAGTGGLIQAAVLAMMTYTGFNILGEMGDEVENPRRNIPIVIAVGLVIIIACYVALGWVVSGALSAAEMKASKVALLDAVKGWFPGWFIYYLNLAALTAGLTSINAVFLAVPREFSALAEDGILPKWIMHFNPERQTFPRGIAVTAIAGCLGTVLNLNPDLYSLVCVSGLMLANAMFSAGSLRLFSLFPEQVASAPITIKKWWLYPAAVLSTIASLAFGILAIAFYWKIVWVMVPMVVIGLILVYRARNKQRAGQPE
jgi:basic amino acid/polyamine antiporter, APA family